MTIIEKIHLLASICTILQFVYMIYKEYKDGNDKKK